MQYQEVHTPMSTHSLQTEQTRRVSYPGELGIPPTAISFDVPGGWATVPVAGALAVVRDPDVDAHGFRANVVVSVDRVSDAVTLSAAAADILADARRSSKAHTLCDERVLEIDGAPAILREQILEVEAARTPLVQFVLLLVVEIASGAARDCIQLTATASESERDALEQRVQRFVRSFSLDS